MEKQIVKIGTVNVYQSDNGTVVDALKSKLKETEQELEKVKKLLTEPDGQPENSDYELTPKLKQALEEVRNDEFTTTTIDEIMALGKEHDYIPLDHHEKVSSLLIEFGNMIGVEVKKEPDGTVYVNDIDFTFSLSYSSTLLCFNLVSKNIYHNFDLTYKFFIDERVFYFKNEIQEIIIDFKEIIKLIEDENTTKVD